jgi:hypothetical protein
MTYGWVQRAAHILHHEDQRGEAAVKRRLHGLLGAMTRHQARAGSLSRLRSTIFSQSAAVLGLVCATARASLTSRVPIMLWHSALARIALTHGGRQGGQGPHQLWGDAARCSWSPMPPHGGGPSRGKNLLPTRRRPGRSCASVWRPVICSARRAGAAAAIQHRISRSWKQTSSS